MKDELTNIGLTNQECEIFKLLSRAKVWELRGQSIEIFFDWNGTPTKARTSSWTLSTPHDSDTGVSIVV